MNKHAVLQIQHCGEGYSTVANVTITFPGHHFQIKFQGRITFTGYITQGIQELALLHGTEAQGIQELQVLMISG